MLFHLEYSPSEKDYLTNGWTRLATTFNIEDTSKALKEAQIYFKILMSLLTEEEAIRVVNDREELFWVAFAKDGVI